MTTFKTSLAEETKNIGKQIASTLQGGDIVLLQGDLGAGKTTLTKGIAEGLGIDDDIASPTFTIMQVYEHTPISLVHVDTYRLEHEEDLIDIGLQDYLGSKDTICLIEWPEKVSSLLEGKKSKTITLSHGDTPEARTIAVS